MVRKNNGQKTSTSKVHVRKSLEDVVSLNSLFAYRVKIVNSCFYCKYLEGLRRSIVFTIVQKYFSFSL